MTRPMFVPETMTLDQLLREFRARGADAAVVVDEYGVTEGVVHLTDAVNEIHDLEVAKGYTDVEMYTAYADQVIETKSRLLEFLITARREGKSVAAYGAPGKGK